MLILYADTKFLKKLNKFYRSFLKSPEHGLGINIGKNLNYPLKSVAVLGSSDAPCRAGWGGNIREIAQSTLKLP